MSGKTYCFSVKNLSGGAALKTDDLNEARRELWLRLKESHATLEYSAGTRRRLNAMRLKTKTRYIDEYIMNTRSGDGVIKFVTVIPPLSEGRIPHEYYTFIPKASLMAAKIKKQFDGLFESRGYY